MTSPKPIPMIFTQLSAIMNDISPVGKHGRNTNQKYDYRKADDINDELHPAFARHQVTPVPTVMDIKTFERTSSSGSVLFHVILLVKYSYYAEDGSSVDTVVTGEGMDSGDKACNKAMTSAFKNANVQVFCIATKETRDSETESHEIKDDPMAKPYQATGEQKAYLMKLCHAKSITDPVMMGKISAALQLKHAFMRDVHDLVPVLFKEISNDHQ